MAKGSKRSLPTAPAWAAVVSELMIEPRKTPWSQSNDSVTSGTFVARRPPKRIAEIGTPAGSSHSGEIDGHCDAGVVKRALGWAAGSDRPSHHTSPSSVFATLVKIELPHRVAMALGLVSTPVPGATPKKPYSGLMARRRPSSSNFIHSMSSPTVSTVHPGSVGMSIAMLVLPQADGKAAAM